MYAEDVEDGKRTYTHIFTHNFLNIQPIFNPEKVRLRDFQPYHQILCILKHVEDVEDRSSTLKGCNAMYVEDVEDGVCSLYATLHTELLILLLMSELSKMSNTMNN